MEESSNCAIAHRLLAQDLHRHTRLTSNRGHLGSHKVCAHTSGHQVVASGQCRIHVRRAGGHGIRRVHIVDRGLQLNVHSRRRRRETDLPPNHASVLRESSITGRRKLLAGLSFSRRFMVERHRHIVWKNRVRRVLHIIVRYRCASPEKLFASNSTEKTKAPCSSRRYQRADTPTQGPITALYTLAKLTNIYAHLLRKLGKSLRVYTKRIQGKNLGRNANSRTTHADHCCGAGGFASGVGAGGSVSPLPAGSGRKVKSTPRAAFSLTVRCRSSCDSSIIFSPP